MGRLHNITLIILILFLSVTTMTAQRSVQIVKGRVTDNVTNAPLVGITVVINNDIKFAAYTDENGNYTIKDVPVGKINIQFSCMGYETIERNGVELNSGKQLVYNVKMTEEINKISELVVRGERNRIKPMNEMAPTSVRTFSVVDAQRYAGTINDISRMSQNYAGVGSGNDSSNDIIIRGNSPFGLLWRMEGVDIYNPNHFAEGGGTGGPISMLNVNSLENSSFYTSAFPAEYPNAYSGVFDINLREGNYDQYEYTGQIGINGVEAGAEGPLLGKNSKLRASFMGYYRYSFLDALKALGYDFGAGTAAPRYQDWTGKINIQSKDAGTFTLFSIGGFADVDIRGSGSFYSYEDADGIDCRTNMQVVGFTHKMNFGKDKKHSYSFTLAESSSEFKGITDTLDTNVLEDVYGMAQKASIKRSFITAQLTYGYKFNKKFNIKTGLVAKQLRYKFFSKDYRDRAILENVDEKGTTMLYQAYVEGLYRINNWLSLNGGVNWQCLKVNNDWSVDPRIGFKGTWGENGKHEVSLGYGLHSQVQGLEMYKTKLFTQPINSKIYPNLNMKMTKAHHLVLGYQYKFNNYTRFKVETYYQHLYNIPIDWSEPASALINYSSISFTKYGKIYICDGTGDNYGVEFTMERFVHNGWYYLGTLSLYDSSFKSTDGKRRNTLYNGNWVGNLLFGKEIEISRKDVKKNDLFMGADIKGAFAGGQREVPVDLEQSIAQNKKVFDYTHAYEKQLPYYMRFDVKVWLKLNQSKITHELGIEVRNVTDRKNVYQYGYDVKEHKESITYQTGLLPLGYYRITF